jgi:hypothetical protein
MPILIRAGIRRGSETQDAVALLDYFRDEANRHPVLLAAVPIWLAQHEQQARERRAEQERRSLEESRREADRCARERELTAITYRGPVAMLEALAAFSNCGPWDFPTSWTWITDKQLLTVPQETLKSAFSSIVTQNKRCWRSLRHKILAALKTIERAETLARMAQIRWFNGSSTLRNQDGHSRSFPRIGSAKDYGRHLYRSN